MKQFNSRVLSDIAKKIHKACAIEEEYPKDIGESVDPLYYCSLNVFPFSSAGKFGFHYVDAKRPKFSSLLVKPNKTTALLEAGIEEALEVYSGRPEIVPAVVFNIDTNFFVYSQKEQEIGRVMRHPVLHVRNNNRSRYIYELRRFLSAMKMSEEEED
jgi:hypothetical protein